jgi:hypothetical protein
MYTEEQIANLSKAENHKIKYDGYYYWWYSKRNGKWQKHCLKTFDTPTDVYGYIKYWIYKYRKKTAENEFKLSSIVDNVMDEVRIYDIVKSDLKTKEKIESILCFKPYATPSELKDYLHLSKQNIGKHLKNLKTAL